MTTATAAAPAYDVFISFASTDRAAAERLRDGLAAAGLRPWIAFVDIQPGADYPSEIVHAVASCRTLLLLVSRAAMASKHVAREVAEADSLQRRILPLYLEAEVELPPRLRYVLRSLHRLKAIDAAGLEAALPKIIDGIRNPTRWQDAAVAPGLVDRVAGRPLLAWSGLFGVALAAGLAVWAMQGGVDRWRQASEQARLDARPESLALLQLGSATREPGAPWTLPVSVTLAGDTRHADLGLRLASREAPGDAAEVSDLGSALNTPQVGGGVMLSATLPRLGRHLTLCLTLPRSDGQRVRLVEVYSALPDAADAATARRYSRSAPTALVAETGQPCA